MHHNHDVGCTKFKTEMDAEALQAMFPHLKIKVA
jgi:hypothetical protein